MDQPDRGKQLEFMREQHALKLAQNDSARRRAWLVAAAALLAVWIVYVVAAEVPEKLKELNNLVLQTITGRS